VYTSNLAQYGGYTLRPGISFLKNWLNHLLKNLHISADNLAYKPSYTVKKEPVPSWGVEMKKTSLILSLLLVLAIFPSLSSGKELPKVAVWDLTPRNTPATHAQELTSFVVSEITKLKKYEVYSQENVRTLAGWTAERMQLGCTDTKCLTALGQMDIAKLISGSVGKIGKRYTVSLNLFDTQKARAENAISKTCESEDELIELIQASVRELLGESPAIKAPVKAESPASIAKTAPGEYREPVAGIELKKMAETTAVIETKFGNLELKFFPDVAPNHVKNFIDLAQKGFYDGTIFHRVIPGFMIQGGDPNTKNPDRSKHGTGGPGYTMKAEFNDKPHKRGTLSMARAADPNSAGSQFFICVAPASFLDKQYTVFGEVVSGMEAADKIVRAPRDKRDNPNERIEMKVKIIEK
jgi:peptidyl-prolyl cis-trans isomerase B (cyclophilin B)